MAVSTNNVKFQKATITFEEGKVLITEYLKDETKTYDLVECLRDFENVDGIALTIQKNKEIPAHE